MDSEQVPPLPDKTLGNVTVLLRAASGGGQKAQSELMDLVYRELRAIAHRQMSRTAHDGVFQPTVLVHEAYFRLFGGREVEWQNRHHFYWAAARAMHDILVQQARMIRSRKRGGDRFRVPLSEDTVLQQSDRLVDLSEELERLAGTFPEAAKVVMLRFFGGMNHAETASTLGVSEATVRRHWRFAKTWLHRALREEHPTDPASVSAFVASWQLGNKTVDVNTRPNPNAVR